MLVGQFVTRRWSLILSIVGAICILCVRIFMLARYSSSVPSWDAWGAEPAVLYGPWLEDTFVWSNLWAWHNEHRIFFTRLLDMTLFLANESQWDVRVQTLVSGMLFASTAGISMWWILRNVEATLSVGLAGVVALCAVCPNGWANAMQGFQSCFYFVLLFAVLSVRSAVCAPLSVRGGLQTALLALAAVFSLAAGVLVAMVCAIVALVRIWIERSSWRQSAAFIAAPLFVAVWSLADAKKGELHPATVFDFLHSLAIMMSWPYASFFGVLLWVPVIVFGLRVMLTRIASRTDLVFGGLALWVVLIDLAAAWTRAYNFVDVQSRYTDLMIPGLIAQVYFAFRLAGLLRHRRFLAPAARFSAIFIGSLLASGVAIASYPEFQKWKATDFYLRIGATYVRAYLDGDGAALDNRLYGYIPYPHPEMLKVFLDYSSTRSILPVSLEPSTVLPNRRIRSCRWTPAHGAELPATGDVTCAGFDLDEPFKDHHYVGRLSAFTYALWKMIGRQSYPEFRRDDQPRAPQKNNANCAVDTVDEIASPQGSLHVPYAAVITFAGWVGPNAVESKRPSIQFALESETQGRFAANTRAGISRPDVAAAAAMPGFSHSGFQAYLDGSRIPAGTYRLKIVTANHAECDSGVDITIGRDADIRLAY